jgi:hypothetical protein
MQYDVELWFRNIKFSDPESPAVFCQSDFCMAIPVSARSEAWVCGRWHVGIAGSNPARVMDVCLF